MKKFRTLNISLLIIAITLALIVQFFSATFYIGSETDYIELTPSERNSFITLRVLTNVAIGLVLIALFSLLSFVYKSLTKRAINDFSIKKAVFIYSALVLAMSIILPLYIWLSS